MSGHGSRSRLETTGLADAVHGRASVRKYAPEPVPREDVEAMVALAVRAANAGNAQPWRFVAVEDADLRAAMSAGGRRGAGRDGAPGPRPPASRRSSRPTAPTRPSSARPRSWSPSSAVPYSSLADELHERARACRARSATGCASGPDIQSLGAAVQLLCTAAHAMGYGSCWMTAPVLAAPGHREAARRGAAADGSRRSSPSAGHCTPPRPTSQASRRGRPRVPVTP